MLVVKGPSFSVNKVSHYASKFSDDVQDVTWLLVYKMNTIWDQIVCAYTYKNIHMCTHTHPSTYIWSVLFVKMMFNILKISCILQVIHES